MNRLEEALYNPSSAGPGVGAQDIFSVSGITYDGIGNIMTLNRQGITQCGGPGGAELVVSAIDQLAYTYANGSRLSEVVDNATHPDLKDLGVKNGGGTYQYDAAGRMTHDNHRGLVIEYNHLDLPRRITDQNNVVTDITYDATGRKWLQQTTTDARIYAGAVVLTKENGTYSLEAANTSDGRLVYDAEAVEVYPEFYHKDHLGNVRVAFADRNKDLKIELLGPTSEITQQNDYYPFGLRQEGDSLVFHQELSSSRYRYNGKEFSEDIGLYDYGARWYDPAVARWTSVDPLAGMYAPWSPYNYVLGNPIRFIDPDGRSVDDIYKLNGNGSIELVAETDDNFDVLTTGNKVKTDDSGNITNGIKVKKGYLKKAKDVSVGKKGSIDGTRISFGSDEKGGREVFEFVADNSNVEWSILTVDIGIATTTDVTTSRHNEKDFVGTDLLGKVTAKNSGAKVLSYDHSHPKKTGVLDQGDHSKVRGGDVKNRKLIRKNNPTATARIRHDGSYYPY